MEQDCCRICLSNTQSNERQDLFGEEQNNLSKVGELYEEVLNLPIANGDLMPRYICNSCDLQLKLFKQLRSKALETYLFLTKILTSSPSPSPIKDENNLEHEENTLLTEYIECDDNDQQENEIPTIATEDELIFEEIEDNVASDSLLSELIECDGQQENDTTTTTAIEPETENEFIFKQEEEQQQQDNEDEDEEIQSAEEFTENEALCFDTSDDEVYEVALLNEDTNLENSNKEYADGLCEEEGLVKEEDKFEIRKKCTRNRIFACQECGEIFQQQVDLRRHNRSMHRITTKIECKICKKVLLTEETYQAHMNIHNGLPAYQCYMCAKSFNQKVHYTYHMLNHKNERNIICDLCQKGFISKSDLKTHMRSHTDERRYKCEICEKTFRAHTHMINHRYSHFEKQFECSECFQKYVSPNTLRMHFKTVHKNEVPFECSFCEKRFKRKHHLQAHYKTHSKALETMQIHEIISS